jgi:NAD+ synthase
MKKKLVIQHIVQWLKDYSEKSNTDGFVVGISGGIDSALTSTLCALTGKKVLALNLPIRQHEAEYLRAKEHIQWLTSDYPNVNGIEVDLSSPFKAIEATFPNQIQDWLSMANTRSRLRMTTLYAFACHHKLLVAGTGNKIEDFGIGFFTKYGDGGVDLSPIADLLKTEVFLIANELGVVNSILNAAPTDGLWADGRTDEDQIGATYPELEWAMQYVNNRDRYPINERQQIVLEIYNKLHQSNLHKMQSIPVCIIPNNLK